MGPRNGEYLPKVVMKTVPPGFVASHLGVY